MFRKLFGGGPKEPVQPPARTEPAFAEAAANAGTPPREGTGKRAGQAGEIIAKLVKAGYQDERGIHVESVLSALASLSGYAAQIAAVRMIKDGDPAAKQFPQLNEVKTKDGQTFLICELANQLVAAGGGPDKLTVLTLVANAGMRAGGKQVPDMLAIMKRNAAHLGNPNYPPLSVPPGHFPKENALVALRRWWPIVVKVFSVAELSDIHPLFWMFALSNETGKLIEEEKDTLHPDVAMALAMETAVAMSKVTGIGSELPGQR
jgi:hypothetical protein